MTLSARNPMNRGLMALLLFAVIAYGLSLPVILVIDHTSPALGWGCVGAVMLAALLGAVTLRRGVGYYLGWAASIGGLLLGLLTSMMWLVGGLFLLLWIVGFVLGKRIEPTTA